MYRRRRSNSPPRRRRSSYSPHRRSRSPQKSPYKWKYVQHPFKPHHDGWLVVKKKKSPSPKKGYKYYKPKAYLPYFYSNPGDARTAAKLLKAYQILGAINSPTPTPSVILASNWPNPVPTTTTTTTTLPPFPLTTSHVSPFPKNSSGKQTKLNVIRASSSAGPLLSTIPQNYIQGVTFGATSTATLGPNNLYVYVVDGSTVDQTTINQFKAQAKGRFIVINLIPIASGSPIPPFQITDPDLHNIQRPLYYDPALAANQSTQHLSWYSTQNAEGYKLIRDLSFAAIV